MNTSVARTGNHGKASLIGSLALVGIAVLGSGILPDAVQAQVNIQVGIALPPPIVFAAPPEVIVLPGSYVYVAPDLAEEMYFVDGWWWRPWQGRWYRSQYYDRDWGPYSSVPSFYGNVHQGWRDDYRDHRWSGQAWDYQRMPHARVEQNWNTWKSTNYWESQQTWGVKDYRGHSRGNDRKQANPQKHDGQGHDEMKQQSQHGGGEKDSKHGSREHGKNGKGDKD